MCKYCDMSYIDTQHSCPDYIIHRPLYLINGYGKRIKADRSNLIMYLREYIKSNTWSLICEFADETMIETPIIYCPRCGRKLVERKRTQNETGNYRLSLL